MQTGMKQILWRLVLATALLMVGANAEAGLREGVNALQNKNYAIALKEFKPLAESGNREAQFHLGSMYDDGLGVDKDEHQAVVLWRKSAEQGFKYAQATMGNLYYSGQNGVPQDYAQASLWFLKAAEQGNTTAQNTLGDLFLIGRGVPIDIVQAYKWTSLAAEGDAKFAKGNLKNIEAKMSSAQIAQGHALAVEWHAQQQVQAVAATTTSNSVVNNRNQPVAETRTPTVADASVLNHKKNPKWPQEPNSFLGIVLDKPIEASVKECIGVGLSGENSDIVTNLVDDGLCFYRVGSHFGLSGVSVIGVPSVKLNNGGDVVEIVVKTEDFARVKKMLIIKYGKPHRINTIRKEYYWEGEMVIIKADEGRGGTGNVSVISKYYLNNQAAAEEEKAAAKERKVVDDAAQGL